MSKTLSVGSIRHRVCSQAVVYVAVFCVRILLIVPSIILHLLHYLLRHFRCGRRFLRRHHSSSSSQSALFVLRLRLPRPVLWSVSRLSLDTLLDHWRCIACSLPSALILLGGPSMSRLRVYLMVHLFSSPRVGFRFVSIHNF